MIRRFPIKMTSVLNVCSGPCLGRVPPGADLQPGPSPSVSGVSGIEMFLWKHASQLQEMSMRLQLTPAAIGRRT